MNTAPFAVPGILAPLQGLLRWFMPASTPVKPCQASADKHAHEFTINTLASKPYSTGAAPQKQSHLTVHRPLRVVRILEADHVQANVGRMMISGRMADVCAELDRLAAHESALH
jgi:hypothetical protein